MFAQEGNRSVVAGLTVGERQVGMAVLVILAVAGLAMAAAGAARMDPMQLNGFLVLLFSRGFLCGLLKGYFAPEPSEARLASHYDDPTKAGTLVAMVRAVFAMFIGDWAAWLLAFPDLHFDAPR